MKAKYLLRAYYLPGTILNLFNVLTPLNLTVAYEVGATIIFIILLGNQDTEVLSHLSKVTQLLRDRARGEGGNLVPKPELLIFAIYCPWACLCFSYSLPQSWLTPSNHTLSLSSAVCWSTFLPWCDLSYAYFILWCSSLMLSLLEKLSQSDRQPGKCCAGSTGKIFAHRAQAGNKVWKIISDSITYNDLESLSLAWRRGTTTKI